MVIDHPLTVKMILKYVLSDHGAVVVLNTFIYEVGILRVIVILY